MAVSGERVPSETPPFERGTPVDIAATGSRPSGIEVAVRRWEARVLYLRATETAAGIRGGTFARANIERPSNKKITLSHTS